MEQREVRFSKDHSIKSDDSEGVMLLTSNVCYLSTRGTTMLLNTEKLAVLISTPEQQSGAQDQDIVY